MLALSHFKGASLLTPWHEYYSLLNVPHRLAMRIVILEGGHTFDVRACVISSVTLVLSLSEYWTTAHSVSKFTEALWTSGLAMRMRFTEAEHPPHFMLSTFRMRVWRGSGI